MNATATRNKPASNSPAMSSTAELRASARKKIDEGAVTAGYSADRSHIVKMLNDALATEIVCMLRYKRHFFMATGVHAEAIAAEFLEHATEEEEHADAIAKRIVQLGGAPDFSPDTLTKRSHAEYVPGKSLMDMVKEDLIAERIAIDSYKEMIFAIGDDDSTTRRLIEWILSVEEEHADDLASLLDAGH